MSDSPAKPNAAHQPASGAIAVARRGAGSARWWAASILFHGLLLGWLLFFSPVRVVEPNTKSATRSVSAGRAARVVEQIREKQAATIEQNLRALREIHGKMAALEKRKREEFAQFAAEMGQNASVKAAAELETIAQAQAELQLALDQAGDNGTRFVQTRANAYFDNLSEGQKLAREKQISVLQLLEQVEGLLLLGGERFAPALAALRQASAAQERAARALAEAEAARDAARWSRKRSAHENLIEHYTYHLKRAQETLLNYPTNLVTAKKLLVAAQAVLARRKTAVEQAVAKATANHTDAAGLAVDTAQKALARAEKELLAAQRKVDDAPKALDDAKKRLPELEAKVAELLAKSPSETVAPTPEDQKLMALQTAARQFQLEAQQAQAKAAQAVTALQVLRDEGARGSAALTVLDKGAPVETAAWPADTKGMHLAQVYEAAVQIEGALAQSYRRLRALELALIRRVPLSKAIQLTEVAKVLRPDLSAALQAAVSSGEEALTAREAVQSAKAEVAAMVRLASSMLAQAQSLDNTAGTTVALVDYTRQFDQWQAMENAAAEDDNEWARDLTPMMGGGQGGEEGDGAGDGGAGGRGGGRGGKGGQDGFAGVGGRGLGPGGAGNGLPDLGLSGTAGPFGGHGPGGFGYGGIPGARGADAAPEDISGRVVPWPGRRVAARGASPQWFFADSWYILGPFDNTGRRNIDKKFPPETVIDLNATYPGKNGVPIRWEFYQSGSPNVMPPLEGYNAAGHDPSLNPSTERLHNLEYIIYYAYTELWFEESCDLWVAIGSDDFSKVWIEEQLVWASGKRLKAWRLNEGLRKVHFKKGINRVLYRVENGNNITEFSLVVSLQRQ